jgi:serine kinase of HPr protein (carbohydrate metabolism regulator)
MLLHASCVALEGDAVLILGPPGSGKSDLALRLVHEGWGLVADDQVQLTPDDAGGFFRAGSPEALRGMLEVRGLGVFRDLPVTAGPPPTLRLAVRLAPRAQVPRLPEPDAWHCAGIAVPAVMLHPFDASTPAKLALALAAAAGRARQAAGAFRVEDGR